MCPVRNSPIESRWVGLRPTSGKGSVGGGEMHRARDLSNLTPSCEG